MKYIIQSCIIGDTKWNYRAEVKANQKAIDFYKDFHQTYSIVIRQDSKLNIQNQYRVITT